MIDKLQSLTKKQFFFGLAAALILFWIISGLLIYFGQSPEAGVLETVAPDSETETEQPSVEPDNSETDVGEPYSAATEDKIFTTAEGALISELRSQGQTVTEVVTREWYLTDDSDSLNVLLYVRLASGEMRFWVVEIEENDSSYTAVRFYKPDSRFEDG